MNLSEEIFDVIDEDDRIIGKCTRTEAHEKGLLHRGATVLVFNKKGEILIQKRSSQKKIDPGKWAASAAGHVESGAGYLETAKRELFEELGIKAKLYEMGKMREKVDFESGLTENEIFKLYMCEHEGPFRPQEEEVDTVTFISIDELVWMIQQEPDNYMYSLKDITGIFFADVPVSENAKLLETKMIDYVDDENNVIGFVPKDEAHYKGLFHRIIWVIVINDKDEILIQQRHRDKDISPLFWDLSAAGHVDTGETYEEAAEREMYEELGIKGELHFIKEGIFSYDHPTGLKDREFYKLYVCRHNGPFKMQENEIEKIRFTAADEIEEMIKEGNEKFTQALEITIDLYRKGKLKQV